MSEELEPIQAEQVDAAAGAAKETTRSEADAEAEREADADPPPPTETAAALAAAEPVLQQANLEAPSPNEAAAAMGAVAAAQTVTDASTRLPVIEAAAERAAQDTQAPLLPEQRFGERADGLARITAVRDWASFGASMAGLAGLGITFYDLAVSKQHNRPSVFDGAVDPAVAQAVQQLVDLWNGLDEQTFWTRVAGFTTDEQPSPGVQIVLMNDIINLSPDAPITWTATAKTTVVDMLASAWQSAPSSMYALVPSTTYGDANGVDQPLPRAIRADCCRLAIGQALLGGTA